MSRKPGQTHVTSLTVDEAARFRAIVPAAAKLAGLTRAQIAELLVQRRKDGRAYSRRPLLDETAVASAFAKREPLRAPLARDIYAVVAAAVEGTPAEPPDNDEAVRRAKIRWSLDLETRKRLGERDPDTRREAIADLDQALQKLANAKNLALHVGADAYVKVIDETSAAVSLAKNTLMMTPSRSSSTAPSEADVDEWRRLQQDRAQALAMLWELFIRADWLRDDRSREPLESDRRKRQRLG